MSYRYIKILLVLGMLAAMCGTVSAAMGIVAETHATSSGSALVCTAPCECISEAEAASRWGAEGYDRCSKTICGQSANAMVQYYCFHQIGGVSTVSKGVTAAAAAATLVTTMPATQIPAQSTIPVTIQTVAQPPDTTAAAAVTPSPSYTWPAPGATPQQRTPAGTATVIAAISMAFLALVAVRKK